MAEFIAYIDEAGDEGFGKLKNTDAGGQSRWLVLGACIVGGADNLRLPIWKDEILARFPGKQSRDIHFRSLKHDQKVVVCQEIAKRPLMAAVALSHKVTIPGTKWEPIFKRKGYLYNYLVRWLLERITTHCRIQIPEGPCSVRLVFSRRGGTDYQSMRDYLILMRDGRERQQPVRSINWSALDVDDIAVESHSKWAGLQIADCMTSAFYAAVEPNVYGNLESRYAECLRGSVLRRPDGGALNHGVAPVPSHYGCQPNAEHKAFFLSFAK
jgi:hypothetical protein